MSEPREIELKLQAEPSDLARLQEHPLLQHATQDETVLTAAYFDTDDQRLRNAGYSLRVRRQDGRHVQTAKAEGDGLIERSEWEQEVAGDALDREALARTPLAALLEGAEPRRRFSVVVERTTYLVEQGQSRIEVALDRGRIETTEAGTTALPVCEIELELKSGEAADVFALAHAVATLVPLRLGVLSKAERGYRLTEDGVAQVRKAEPVPVREDMPAAGAFRAVAHACLRHMRQNEDILLDGRNADALHQMRVAVRRLRSAFSLFGDLVADPQGDRLRADLKRLTEPLGRARNLDVFLSATLPAERERHPDEPGLLNLEKHLEAQRTEAYEAVQAMLRSDEWRTLILDLVAWINVGPWLRAEDPDTVQRLRQPASDFAANVLDRRRRQVKRRGRDLDRLSPEERHQVRIAAKKLRYGAEFFAGLYTGRKAAKRHKAFVKALSELQDHLGELNDIATGHELLDDLAGADLRAASTLFAAGVTAADLESRTRKLLSAAAEAHEELLDLKPFWR